MDELEQKIDELGEMYDELVARALSFNTICEKYQHLSLSGLIGQMQKTLFEIHGELL